MTLNESVLEAGEVLAAVIAAGDRMQAETQATQQKVAAAIPAIVEDLATGGFIEAHEKAAMASALRDPVSALKVMSNLVAEARRQIKSASAATAKVAAPVLGSPTNLVLGSRGTEGRDSYSAFEDALFGNR